MIKESSCNENARIDGNKLAGKWNYVAQVSIWTNNIYCGHMFLKNEAEGRFSGYWVGKTDSTLSNITLNAHLYNDTFELSFDDIEGSQLMKIKTCNGDDEFALEDRANDWYYIFSKNNEISPAFFDKYQSVADSNGLLLTIMNADDCEKHSRSTREKSDDEDDEYDYEYIDPFTYNGNKYEEYEEYEDYE
ncbi:hypothetical protein PV325_003496 [Microctonus aethiopoides]|nr:hypothetical protein PV325_003496 [Microctonus aethiopoides]